MSFLQKGLLLSTISLFFLSAPALAADPEPIIADPAYWGVMVNQSESDGFVMTSGETKNITFTFKNKGTKNWVPGGNGYISAYTMEPRYRKSAFESASWLQSRQPAAISEPIAPGERGELIIEFTAPEKPGKYTEEFYLAAENKSWVKDSYFYIDVVVKEKPAPKPVVVEKVDKKEAVNAEPKAKDDGYAANHFMQNVKKVQVKGGEEIKLILGFQNTGKQDWKNIKLAPVEVTALAAGNEISFADDSWRSANEIVRGQNVPAGGFYKEIIYIRAPVEVGEYTAELQLEADGYVFTSELVQVDIKVTSDAPTYYKAPFVSNIKKIEPVVKNQKMPEPRIRVGLYKPKSFVQIRSYDDDYKVMKQGKEVGILRKGRMAVLKFDEGIYSVKSGSSLDIKSASPLRLEPRRRENAIFELINYDRFVSWKAKVNFNRYRGAVELLQGERTKDVWIVNDLNLEDYVKGIGENLDTSPIEYLKAQTIAQRSYAMATIRSDKYGVFDVVATTGDQLYLAVGTEEIQPNFVKAAEATTGQFVTYNGEIVITPYFAHTGGWTNSWQDVWGGAVRPWLVSVTAEYDKARYSKDFGHGVGMSQVDAAHRADKEGVNAEYLIKYYYTGTEVEKMY